MLDIATALNDLEKISAAVHDSWMESKRANGITSRLSETGEELMVPYKQLSEAAKQLDRATEKTVMLAQLKVLGGKS